MIVFIATAFVVVLVRLLWDYFYDPDYSRLYRVMVWIVDHRLLLECLVLLACLLIWGLR